jgi:hypothetical protein
MLRVKLLLAVVGLSFVIGQTSMADVIQNGGFETLANPIVHSNDDYTTPLGLVDPDTGVPGWHLSSSSAPDYALDIRPSDFYHQSGLNCMVLEGGWLYQDITVEAGPMVVSFYAQDWYAGVVADPLAVTLDGAPLLIGGQAKVTAPKSADLASAIWTKYTTDEVTLAAGTYRLQITADPYVGSLCGVFIDDVTAGVPTPEPASIVLLASGVLGLLAYAWRKRK